MANESESPLGFGGEATQMSYRTGDGEQTLGIADLIRQYRERNQSSDGGAQAGKVDPLNALIELAWNRLEQIARRQMRSGGGLRGYEQTVDLLQQTWMTRIQRILNSPDTEIHSTEHFFALSGKLIRETLIDMRRKTIRKDDSGQPMERMVLAGADDEGRDNLAKEAESVEASMLQKQIDVAEAMSQLKPEFEQILDMMVIHGLSRRDTAETLGVTEAEVRTRLLKAQAALGKILRSGYDDGPDEG